VGLRDRLNSNPKIGALVGAGLLAMAAALVVWLRAGENRTAQAEVQTKGWYSTDDGATWFADDVNKVAPFQTPDGKTAVKAVVFRCGHGKTFVAYLERRAPQPQKPEQPAGKDGGGGGSGKGNPYADYFSVYRGGIQVKPPKAGTWVGVNEPAALKVLTPVCPEGSQDNIEPVLP
jgi:hypothetical protein